MGQAIHISIFFLKLLSRKGVAIIYTPPEENATLPSREIHFFSEKVNFAFKKT
jgi:hypothetical protein